MLRKEENMYERQSVNLVAFSSLVMVDIVESGQI